jgi:hypothetical protein
MTEAITPENIFDNTDDFEDESTTTVSASDPLVTSNPIAVGHMWINSTTGNSYICTDITAGANVWTNIQGDRSLNGLSDTTVSASDPTVSANPSAVGHLWINSTSGEQFIATTITAGANVWTNTGEGSGGIIPSIDIEYLVVGGGGGGGAAYGDTNNGTGGGGAGGYRTNYAGTALQVTPGSVYTVTIGAGGPGASAVSSTGGSNGVASSIIGTGISITSSGGGNGGGADNITPGGNGGSGGGSGGWGNSTGFGDGNTPSTSPSQGNNGGQAANCAGGGGGGAGAVGVNGNSGSNSGAGGTGTSNSISGSAVYYAGGGGGGGCSVSTNGGGAGNGGGGNGGDRLASGGGGNGTDGLGGGGGGSGSQSSSNAATPGDGGNGVVYIRMLTSDYSGTTSGSPTVDSSTVSGTTILRFLSSGSFTG